MKIPTHFYELEIAHPGQSSWNWIIKNWTQYEHLVLVRFIEWPTVLFHHVQVLLSE